MSSRIVRRDGTELALEELVGRYSATLFKSYGHYELCGRVARLTAPDPAVADVLHNLLSIKSRELMGATALLQYAATEGAGIERAVLPAPVAAVIGERLQALGIGVERQPGEPEWIPRGVALAFAAKVLLNRLFRLLRRPLVAGMPLVRAWVDVTEAMYGHLFPAAQLRVYPFPFGLGRQAAFARGLARRGLRWSFDGVPYRWADALAPCWPARRRHQRLAAAEWRAYDGFARELLAAGVTEVHSSDDFEVGSVAAGERLLAAGAAYVNTAHGVGLYSPRVAYSRFFYLNDYQARFYRDHGSRMELRKRPTRNSDRPFERSDVEGRPELALVYVHQDFEHYNLPSETAAQRAILAELSRVAAKEGIVTAIKLHPNMAQAAVRRSLPANLRVLVRWSDVRAWRPVFLTINSTAYYELAEVAPVLVYAAPTYDPAVYLDGELEPFTVPDLSRKAQQLRDPARWAALVDRQARSLGAGAC